MATLLMTLLAPVMVVHPVRSAVIEATTTALTVSYRLILVVVIAVLPTMATMTSVQLIASAATITVSTMFWKFQLF